MRAGRKSHQQQIDIQLLLYCFDVLRKLRASDEPLSSQKKSHGRDRMLLSALRQARAVGRQFDKALNFKKCFIIFIY